jgi:WD40 repeat protein
MRASTVAICCIAFLLSADHVTGQPAPKAAGEGGSPPLLRLEAGGPTAPVTALAFSPDSQTLYAAGFDKIVRAWQRDAQSGQFTPATRAYRVPVGPGTAGILNALAVSPDGEWLAVSGLGLWQDAAGFREAGKVFPVPALNREMRRQRATIYLFQTKPPHGVKVLRGHEGVVVNLRFAPGSPGKPSLLVSLAREPAPGSGGYVGRACLWDIDKAAYRDAQDRLIDAGALVDQETLTRKVTQQDAGLAVRRVGPALKQLHVAVAWGDGLLRIWDPDASAGTERVRTVQDGLSGLNNTVAVLSDGQTLVTGGGQKEEPTPVGRLQLWKDAQATQPAAEPIMLPPGDDNLVMVPRALCLLPFQEKGKPDYGVAALRVRPRKAREDFFSLLLVDLMNGKALTPDFLWRDNHRLPVLAASPDGRDVAVAGGPGDEIWIYPAADLLRGKDTKQELKSAGTSWHSLAFLERPAPAGGGKELGLLLSTRPSARWGRPEAVQAEDLVFDFAGRRLTPDPLAKEWKVTGPAENGWEIVRVDSSRPKPPETRSRWTLTWKGPDGEAKTSLLLGPTDQVKDTLVLPPTKAAPFPLLAVAIWDATSSEPSLRLYKASTGEPVRQYVGHSHRIISLAASPDGKLLASAADDQTVCVWSLTDLDRILDRQGGLSGLVVEERGRQLTVTRIDANCLLHDQLAVGDTIESLTVRGRAKPLAPRNAVEFYDALWNLSPGTRAALAIRHEGQPQSLAFTVGQGVDEQHPLFFFFVPEGTGANRDWIGWSPLGPFDASSPDAELHVGWHFNPKRLEEPATFAPVRTKRYHDEFYRRGVLGQLVALGKTVTEAPPVPIPRPRISLEGVTTAGPAPEFLGQDHFLVRERRVRVRLKVEGPSLKKEQVESITWQLDGGPDREQTHRINLASAVDQGLTQEIELPAARSSYNVHVQLRTREATPQIATASFTLLYRLPPPQIHFAKAWLRKNFGEDSTHYGVVKNANFVLEAQVRSRNGIKVRLQHNDTTVEPTVMDGAIRREMKLTPGQNRIMLRAWNADLPEAEAADEITTESLLLVYQPEPAPELRLTSVGLGDEEREAVAIQPGQPVSVRTAVVHIHGVVKAGEELPTLEVTDKEGHHIGTAELRPTGAEPAQSRKTYSFERRLDLRPDHQTFVFRAQGGEKTTTANLTLDYQPPLPEIDVLAPANDTSLTEGKDEPVIQPRVRFTTGSEFPFELAAEVVNGNKPVVQEGNKAHLSVAFQRVAEGRTVDLSRLRLSPGQNRVELTVSRGREKTRAVERHIFYRQPPRIVRAGAKEPVREPFTDLTATVASPTEPRTVRVRVNEQEIDASRTPMVRRIGEVQPPTWEVRVNGVPIPQKQNTVKLWVGNADSISLEPFTVQVAGMRPPVKPPEVQIITQAGPVTAATSHISFRVRSDTPVTAVELRRDGKPPQPYAPLSMEPTPQGGLELRGAFDVDLREGVNAFTIVARNEGGEGRDAVELSRPRPPVRLVVESPPPSSSGPDLRLRGSVQFRDAEEAARNTENVKNLRVYANEFLQRPAVLEAGQSSDPRTVAWHVDVLLNRPVNNLQVECPNLPVDTDRPPPLVVRCDHPVPPATLHLLVVGVGAQDKRLLVSQAFKALQTRSDPVQGLRSPVFPRVVMHPYAPTQKVRVLADNVTQGKVRNALRSIRAFIETQGTANDVVMIYWLGKNAHRDQGAWYLPTSDSSPGQPPSDTDVAINELLGADEETPGARILLLDTPSVRAMSLRVPGELADTHAGVIHYAWSRAEQPLQGLLLAVERASGANKPISLQDVVHAAEQMQEKHPETLQVSHNLRMGSPLAALVITASTAGTNQP